MKTPKYKDGQKVCCLWQGKYREVTIKGEGWQLSKGRMVYYEILESSGGIPENELHELMKFVEFKEYLESCNCYTTGYSSQGIFIGDKTIKGKQYAMIIRGDGNAYPVEHTVLRFIPYAQIWIAPLQLLITNNLKQQK